MNDQIFRVRCPVCHTSILLDNKHWVITCNGCKKDIEIAMDNGKIVAVRQYIYPPSYHLNNVEIFIEYVEKHMPLTKWGFRKSFHPEKAGLVIYDSEFCRVMFELSVFHYYPLYETIIYYGRLHAPDNEKYMTANGEKCLCWHSHIHLTLPFIEGISAQQLADERYGETWESLVDKLKVDYPHADYLEYPLRLHAKIWEHYGEKLFSVFDLRQPEVWNHYSKFSMTYEDAVNRRLNLSHAVGRIC